LKAAFERFIDAGDKTDQDIAELVRRSEIDIAVDLTGHTQHSRFSVFARRSAPIQVNYLGYLGTLGAKFIDYVIADKIALPFDQQSHFDEKIIHLPDCFLATDDCLEIAAWDPSRQEAGLPANGFVFSCFNASYKLTRPVFEAWMRVLRAVPDSVLWLVQSNDQMLANLRSEAERLRVDPARLVFASHLPLPQHLARQRLAGLFLDTVPYNAGATGVAALWSGVPVLTICGETFVGRMAASMLHGIGLPELVTHNLDDYEALAVKLAREPVLLAGFRRRLEENKPRMPLFDTDRFRRHLEQAYTTMVEIQRRGDSPHSFNVEPSESLVI
jgi:predicted O-linked N-acetylglucosamine transferase (SPINDLY family)